VYNKENNATRKLMSTYKDEVQSITINQLDCFGGADGAVWFSKYKALVDDLAIKADNGDNDAIEVIKIMRKYNRLLELAKKM
jgi:hypothetical protein